MYILIPMGIDGGVMWLLGVHIFLVSLYVEWVAECSLSHSFLHLSVITIKIKSRKLLKISWELERNLC